MTDRQYNLKDVKQILHLKEEYEATSVHEKGPVLEDPVTTANLVVSMTQFPDVFSREIGQLEARLKKEQEATSLVAHLVTTVDPYAAIRMMGLSDLEYRAACVRYYDSLNEERREEILRLEIR